MICLPSQQLFHQVVTNISMVYFYILFILIIISYLTGFFDAYKNINFSYSTENSNSLIEFLTKYKTKTKNYSNPPENYTSYSNNIPSGNIFKDKVRFAYEFPLIKSERALFDCYLYPAEISNYVDLFGLSNMLIVKNKNGFRLKDSNTFDELSIKMNQNCWYFNSFLDFGVDYKKLVTNYVSFTYPISKVIYNKLAYLGQDSYLNRVQAALNFVQFLPYGLPDFDTKEWYYFGVSTPPESFILGYSDCDSKSIFFASILARLIPLDNIILIECTVNSTNESENGNHMMVAIAGLEIRGEMISCDDKEFILIETTTPIEIGTVAWSSFKLNKIIKLS